MHRDLEDMPDDELERYAHFLLVFVRSLTLELREHVKYRGWEWAVTTAEQLNQQASILKEVIGIASRRKLGHETDYS